MPRPRPRTDPALPWARHLRELERRRRARGARDGARAAARVRRTQLDSPIFLGRLGWRERRRCASGRARSAAGAAPAARRVARAVEPERTARRRGGWPATSCATAAYLNWRFADCAARLPLLAARERLRGRRAQASRGVEAAYVATSSRRRSARRARCSRRVRAARGARALLALLAAGARARVRSSAGFVPTPATFRLLGKSLDPGALPLEPRLALRARRHGLPLMRRLVFITQQVDPAHPALAATVPKIRALAARVDELVVLADGAAAGALPANCARAAVRASVARSAAALRFEAALARELRPRPVAVVAHMCPIYAVLGGAARRARSGSRCSSGSRTGRATRRRSSSPSASRPR